MGLDHVDEGTLKVREQDCWIWSRRRERYQPLAQSVYNGPDRRQNGRKLRRPPNINQRWRPASFVFLGGSRDVGGARVTPGVLSGAGLATPTAKEGDAFAIPEGLHGRRLALARWIAAPANPLATLWNPSLCAASAVAEVPSPSAWAHVAEAVVLRLDAWL